MTCHTGAMWLAPFFLVALAVGPVSRGAEPSRTRVEELLSRYGSNAGPGCAAGVLFQGRVVFEGASGTADGSQALTASTPFYLASVSKQFTAAAGYKVAQSAALRLDESVRARFLLELPASAATSTARQLLTH